jgi:4-aminobutyrate aminotransferase-like enzyme
MPNKTLLAALLLQAFAGIVTVSVGHCHPEVVKAVNAQSEVLQHTTTIYLNNQIAEYAKELADRMPGNLKVWHCAMGDPQMGACNCLIQRHCC